MKLKYLILFIFFLFPFSVNAKTLEYSYIEAPSRFDLNFYNEKVKGSSYFQNYLKDYPKYVCVYFDAAYEYICFFGKNDDFDNSNLIQSTYAGVDNYAYRIQKDDLKSRKELVYSPSYTQYYTSEMYNDDVWYSQDIRILWFNYNDPYYFYSHYYYFIDSNIYVTSPINFIVDRSGIKYSCVANESNLFDVENTCRPSLVGSDDSNYKLAKKIVGLIPVEFEFIYSIFSVFIAVIKFLCVIAPIILVIKLIGGVS